jgi:hypothetical protein
MTFFEFVDVVMIIMTSLWFQDCLVVGLTDVALRLTLALALTAASAAPQSNATAPSFWFNGLNIPWNDFGYDIGGGAYDHDWFETFFAQAEAGGQNAARFWVHANGNGSPSFASDGKTVTGLPATFLSDLKVS